MQEDLWQAAFPVGTEVCLPCFWRILNSTNRVSEMFILINVFTHIIQSYESDC